MDSATSPPIWDRVGTARHRNPLVAPLEADVVIVGAGVTGLTAALKLAREGRRVAVLERHGVGEGATGMSSAHVTALLDRPYVDLLHEHGEEVTGRVLRAATEAVAIVEAHAREMPDGADFARVPGYLWAEDEAQRQRLRDEFEVLTQLGVAASLRESSPLPFPVMAALGVEGQARVHPRRYITGLAAQCVTAGVQIHEDTAVVSFEEGDTCVLRTDEDVEVRAGRVIFAAHAPLTRVALQTRCIPYTTYVAAFRADDVSDLLATDLTDPYHYVRALREGATTWWVVGGCDHRTGQERHTETRFDALDAWCRERFGVRPEDISYRWTSQVHVTPDGLPFVGKVPGNDRLYLATGFGGTGLTWGSLAGEILASECLDLAHPHAELFSPSRLDVLGEAARVVREAATTSACYIGDHLQAGEAASLDEVPRGAGCVVRRGLKLYAAYRDDRGRLTVLDAICTHLGSVVRFNPAAKTWDCPCHGSRYDTRGDVIEGPALKGLAHVAPEELDEAPVSDGLDLATHG